MARPTKYDQATRAALLDAAERLLAEGGPDAVSVRSTADAIGTSTRAVYSAFGSKAALIEGLAARGYGYLADLVGAVPRTDDPAADLVRAGIDGFRDFATTRPHLFRLTFDRPRSEVYLRPGVSPELRRSYSELRFLVDRSLAAQRLTDRISADHVAFMFHAVCHGLASNELSRMPPPIGTGFWSVTADMDPVMAWRTTLTAFVRGLELGSPSGA